MGDLYLNVVESKNKDTGGFERQSIILFADDLQEFLTGFDEALRVLEKEVREKRKGGQAPKPRPKRPDNEGRRVVKSRGKDNRGPGRKAPGEKPLGKPRKRVVKRSEK